MPTGEYYFELIEKELSAARVALDEGNPGKVRVCARRGAGQAIAWFLTAHPRSGWGLDVLSKLHGLETDASFPKDVRDAAGRLTTKISHQFTYPFSSDPIKDAIIIIDCIKSMMVSDVS